LPLAVYSTAAFVNISVEAPSYIYELTALAGEKLEPSADPPENPWHLYADASLARSLGF
jgi:UDP-glucose 4-epimerase